MNSFDGVDYDAIKAAVRAVDVPYADVVDRSAPVPLHLLHYDIEGNWAKSPLIYAHRNGNGCMLVKLKDGAGYRMCRYWKDIEEVNKFATRFTKPTAEQLFPFISTSDTETLQLLPKSAARPFTRFASFREHLIDLTFERGGEDAFTLAWLDKPDLPRLNSPRFVGKPWESEEAVQWCQRMLPSVRAQQEMDRVNLTASTAVFGELEDHPLAFMF